MKKSVLYGFILLLFFGCKNHPEDSSVFFGGEIINPKSNILLLMKNTTVIDTLLINKEHSFGKRYPNLKPGLYIFKHGYEFQYVYLEPNDSISLRLNTWDFDETLVFDGQGADKNEFLIKMFLANEREASNFYTYYSLGEAVFEEKINDIYVRHTTLLKKLVESNNQLSERFLYLANAVVNYPIYQLKEMYPYYHNKTLRDSLFYPTQDFYAYRDQDINLNDSLLTDYYAYQNYVSSYLYNISYQENRTFNLNDNFKKILLKNINKKIHLPKFKNRLLYQQINDILFDESCTIDSDEITLFLENSTDSIEKNTVKQLLADKEYLANKTDFPDFLLRSKEGELLHIRELIKNRKAVIYFWSSKQSSNDNIVKRIRYLTKKYPDLLFLGINMSKSVASNYYINKLENQYSLPLNSTGRRLVSNQYPRTILVDSLGKVVNNFTLLSGWHIERQLQSL